MADGRSLYAWTPIQSGDQQQVLNAINIALEQLSTSVRELNTPQIPTLHSEPTKVYDGLIVKADGVNWDPGSGGGVYCYDEASASWLKLS